MPVGIFLYNCIMIKSKYLELPNNEFVLYVEKLLRILNYKVNAIESKRETNEIIYDDNLRNIILNCRYIIELLQERTGIKSFKKDKNSNPNAFIDEQAMSHGLHPRREIAYSTKTYIDKFNSLVNLIIGENQELFSIKAKLFNINEYSFEESFSLNEENNNPKEFNNVEIKKRLHSMDTDDYWAFEGVFKKQTIIFYNEKYKNIPFNTNIFIVANKSQVEIENKPIFRKNIFKIEDWSYKHSIGDEYIFSDIFKEYYDLGHQYNFITALTEEFISEEFHWTDKVVDALNKTESIIDSNEIILNLLSLINQHNPNLEKNKAMCPLYYEFWTKSPRNFSISLKQKEILYYIVSKTQFRNILMQNNFKNKPNRILANDLYSNKVYEKRINQNEYNSLIKEQKFNENYDEFSFKINGDKIVFKWINDLYQSLSKLISNKNNLNINYQKQLPNYKNMSKILISLFQNGLSIISGTAGTGKTKVVENFLKIMEDSKQNTRILLVTPTHKSSRIIPREFTLTEIGTIQHWFKKEKGKLVQIESLLQFETLIIDESSMIEDQYFIAINSLLNNHLSNIKRVIIVGDHNQIPPINSSGFYKQFIIKELAKKGTLIHLDKNHRQQDDELNKYLKKFLETGVIINEFADNGVSIKEFKSLDELYKLIEKTNHDKILTKHNYGPYGNRIINNITKPLSSNIYDDYEMSFDIGEEVIVNDDIPTTNKLSNFVWNNKILRVKEKTNDGIIFNKKVGLPKGWNYNQWFVNEDNYLKFHYSKNYYTDDAVYETKLLPAKSISFHASQGSTYEDVAVILEPNVNYKFESIYTAITRHSKNLTIYIHGNEIEKYKNEIKSFYSGEENE